MKQGGKRREVKSSNQEKSKNRIKCRKSRGDINMLFSFTVNHDCHFFVALVVGCDVLFSC